MNCMNKFYIKYEGPTKDLNSTNVMILSTFLME